MKPCSSRRLSFSPSPVFNAIPLCFRKPCAPLTYKIHPKQVLNGHQTALTTLGVLGGPMSVMRKSKREALANITNSPQQCEFPSLKAPASQPAASQ